MITFSIVILIPQSFGQAVRRPSQFSRCACQDKKQKDKKLNKKAKETAF